MRAPSPLLILLAAALMAPLLPVSPDGSTVATASAQRSDKRYGPTVRRSRAQALKEDMDQDGVPDSFDQCMGQREDFDGFEDNDGCPDTDNDGDGIPDRLDGCPDEAEDIDGFEDLGGCPDPDNDGDGILDADDQCPLEPETVNKRKDEDGCPD
jgi:hypothetical protein